MKRLYSYVVAWDFGFAPNPFYGYCTLATCKPKIRKGASVGDWVVGTGSKAKKRGGRLVYAMRVGEILSLNDYWNDPRFRDKRPNRHGGKRKAFGDNIYRWDEVKSQWHQSDSFHSCDDGSLNSDNLCRDTSVDRMLVSDDFVYFGGSGPLVPESLRECVHVSQGHKCNFPPPLVDEFVKWIMYLQETETGYCGTPTDWT